MGESPANNIEQITSSVNKEPLVAILLCTYNGQEFLQEQLDSFATQTHRNWALYVSDDGSTDATLEIIAQFAKKVGEHKVTLFKGPRKGFAANFLSLIHHNEITADYYAFSDQDDIWLPKKLEVATKWLNTQDANVSALYCSRTILIDAKGKVFGKSDLFLRPPSFANALVQSIGGGNTMVLNRAARNLISAHSPDDGIISHDWWVYILVSGNEGAIQYDSTGHVLYRQHGGNLVGMNGTWMARVKRAILLFRGRFRRWNDHHELLITSHIGFLTPNNFQLFRQFCLVRQCDFFARVRGLKNSPFYRQTRLGNMGLVIGNAFKKV